MNIKEIGEIMNEKMSYDDYPASYRASDRASLAAHNQFVKFTFLNLGLMIIAAIVGSVTLNNNTGKLTLAITSAILLTIGVFVTIVLRNFKLEQIWYEGRAIAESSKTLTWRYMMGTDPYPTNIGSKADELFIASLQSLIKERSSFAARLCDEYFMDKQITDKMRFNRRIGTQERKQMYLSERIDDQRRWYNQKSQANLRSANRYFIMTISSQVLAIIAAFTVVLWQGSLVQFTGIFTTLASAIIAWTQMRRNEELAQSYGLAGQELNFIFEQSSLVENEEQFLRYVANAEMAISREHTMWLARKN
jgi:hypothetical protein